MSMTSDWPSALAKGNGALNGNGVCQGAGQVGWLFAAGSEIWPFSTVVMFGPWLLANVVLTAVHACGDTERVITAFAVKAALALPRLTGRRTASEFQSPAATDTSLTSTMDCEREDPM